MSRRRTGLSFGRRLLELAKDLLIAVLLLVILILAVLALPRQLTTQTPWLAGLLRPVAGLLGFDEAELAYTAPPVQSAVTSAAQPIAVTLRNTAGRHSAQYDFDALDELSGQLGGLLAQALDSAGTPQSAPQAELLDALGRTSIAFCYPGAILPQTTAAWLSVRAPAAEAAQWYVLAQDGDGVRLYLAGERCFSAATGIQAGAFAAQLEPFLPDGSFFAFEDRTGSYDALDALSLISAPPRVQAGAVSNPCDVRFVAAMAGRLGFNPYGDARYVDNAGTTHFTETTCTLSVSAQGTAELTVLAADARFAAGSERESDRIEAARALLMDLSGGAFGDARLYLRSFRETEGGAVCTFSYYLGGIELSEADAPAEVIFSGTQIVSARIRVRTCTRTTDAPELLRPAQAAAIISGGSTLQLIYVETADGQLRVNWKK